MSPNNNHNCILTSLPIHWIDEKKGPPLSLLCRLEAQPALGRLETRLWVCESVLLSRMMFKPRFAAPCLSPGCNKSLQVTQLQFHRSTIRCQREMNNRIAMKRGLEDADHQSNNSGNTRKPVSHSRQGPGYKRIIFWNLA